MRVRNINDTQVTTDDGWVVSVKIRPYGDEVQVWLAKADRSGVSMCYFDGEGRMSLKEIKEMDSPEPTMKINGYIWDGIKQAINGVEETPDKKALDAELTSTKYHLEDMRSLVFKK